jgi:putative hydrolase of the HAD superfamily
MAQISAIFSDVGGVLGTNGWDRDERRRAAEHFKLDRKDFEGRHELVVGAFETGKIDLNAYLDHTVFCRPRNFSREEFVGFMKEQSQPFPAALHTFEELAAAGKYLNNESLDLNLYRISKFGLKNSFTVFFSSCFLGLKKPDAAIFKVALCLTQRAPEETLFIDDRALNVEAARRCGMNAIQCLDPARLGEQLLSAGVSW